MSSPISYERGDAREDVLEAPVSPPPPAAFPVESKLYELTTEQYWEWLTTLVDEGSQIDQELDELLDEIYECNPPFYSLAGRRELRRLLNELHEARAAVRAYEYDVEELTYAFTRAEVMDSQAADNADMTLSQIKATYNRGYDLCLYKLDRMSDGWITASNFLISLVMLVVTILFWMEFR